MMFFTCIAGAVMVGVLGVQLTDDSQVRFLQTEIDQGQPIDKSFAIFKQIFNKSYNDEYQDAIRRKIFEVNVKYIQDHNLLFARGEKSYYLGVNQFTDLIHEEFLRLHTGLRVTQDLSVVNTSTFISPSNLYLPNEVDWRDKGLVTDVKDQGNCGSCWAFSTTGVLEGQHARKTGKLVSLSEQQLVGCSGAYGNLGCQGGWPYQALKYIYAVGGIEGESDYPYDPKKSVCKFKKEFIRATVRGIVKIPSGSETSLQTAVATVGPISVAIDANHMSFQFYKGGVYDEPACSSSKLDHAVLVVGYGSNYWLVKNSWGTSWGEKGYIKMSRNKNNQCGIATSGIYPLV